MTSREVCQAGVEREADRALVDGAIHVRGGPAGVIMLFMVVVRRLLMLLLVGLLRETGDCSVSPTGGEIFSLSLSLSSSSCHCKCKMTDFVVHCSMTQSKGWRATNGI